MTINLGRLLPDASNGLPEGDNEADRFIPSYLAFLRVGFTMPALSPGLRWALTPPFHPCLIARLKQAIIGGIFSVALSLESLPVPVKDHHVLWSSDFPPHLSSAECRVWNAECRKRFFIPHSALHNPHSEVERPPRLLLNSIILPRFR